MAVTEKTVKEVQTVAETINDLVAKGQKALKVFETFDQEKIDKIVHAMVLAGLASICPLQKWQWKKLGAAFMKTKS